MPRSHRPGKARRYSKPQLELFHVEIGEAWAAETTADTPDDSLRASGTPSSEPTRVLGWAAPEGTFGYGLPSFFVAPKDPGRVTGTGKVTYTKTTKKNRRTRTAAKRTRITGQDEFGFMVCTCDMVCTCNLVCTCQAVSICSCVSVCSCVSYHPRHRSSGGTYCSCVPVCTCVPVAH
jgi:hypothetical protein